MSQIISSSPYVTLKDGLYTLSATVRNSKGFDKLTMYANSGEKLMSYKITGDNPKWKTIELKHIMVKNGQVEIGFLAKGKAASFCQVDDVSFAMETRQ